jgi:flagellar biosynthetic protein FliR
VIDGPFVGWGTALLAFVRIVTVFVQAPIFGGQHFKAPIKIGMAASVTLLAFPHLPVPDPFPSDIRGFILAILTQICVGLVIGWVSFLVMATAQFGGEMLDVQMGLSAAAQADPSSHGAVNLLRRLHFYAAMLTYLMFDGHHKMWEAIFYSFQKIPLTYFQMTQVQIETMIAQGSEMYRIGLQISSPAVAALFVAQIALGLLARVAPQMNVFMLSFPMNLAVGLMLLTISLPFILKLLERRMEINNEQVQEAIILMIPPKPGTSTSAQPPPLPSIPQVSHVTATPGGP